MSSNTPARTRQPWVDLITGMAKDGAVDLPFSFCLARAGERIVLVDMWLHADDRAAFLAKVRNAELDFAGAPPRRSRRRSGGR